MSAPKGTVPWNAGTSKGWVDSRGYRWLYVTENGKRVARREHRVIMERHLGRKLEPWELVHHKDENTANNEISNLEVREFGEHTAEHSIGRRKSQDARRSMEAFALLREELRRVRKLNADLLEAAVLAIEYDNLLRKYQGPLDVLCDGDVVDIDAAYDKWIAASRAAIARATGEQP